MLSETKFNSCSEKHQSYPAEDQSAKRVQKRNKMYIKYKKVHKSTPCSLRFLVSENRYNVLDSLSKKPARCKSYLQYPKKIFKNQESLKKPSKTHKKSSKI